MRVQAPRTRRLGAALLSVGMLVALTGVESASATVTNSNLWWDSVGAYNCGTTNPCDFLFTDVAWANSSGHGLPKPVSAIPDASGGTICANYSVYLTDEYLSGANDFVEFAIEARTGGGQTCNVAWRLSWGAPS